MHTGKASGVALSIVTGAALVTGCSGESAPVVTQPNGTIEQVVNNADYADTIGKLALTQRIDVETPDDQRHSTANKGRPASTIRIRTRFAG
jgi:hypothetical protein